MMRNIPLAPKWLFSIPLAVVLLIAVACGQAAEPSTQAATQAPPAATQASVPATEPPAMEPAVTESDATMAPASENTPAPTPQVVFTIVPTSTPLPEGETVSFPLTPDWVSQGKQSDKILRFTSRSKPGQWDVHYCASLWSCLKVSGPKFNQLIEYDPVNPTAIICDLCESWTVTDGGTTYTFRLHDALWSDGQPVTAEDIVFTFDRIAEPGAIRSRTGVLAQFYEHGTGEAIDEKTVRIPIKFPAATFLPNLATDYMKMYPKHLAENLSQEDANCCAENLLGSGPWVFKGQDIGVSYEYDKNPNYFKPGRPFFEGFKVFVIRDQARAAGSLKIGQLDATYGLTISYPPELMDPLEQETQGRLVSLKGSGTFGALILHMNQPPFDDVRMRQAVALALDRQEFVDVAARGNAILGTFFTPGIVETQEELAQVPGWRQPKEQDLTEARRLIAEAGYADGFEGSLNTGSSKNGITHAEVLTEQLRQIGIDLKIDPVDTATYHVKTREGTHPMTMLTSAIIIPDPSDIISQVFAKNIEKNPDNWSDPRFEELMAAQNVELDPAKRLELFKEMVEILRRGESHWVPINWQKPGGAMDCHIQNYKVPLTIQLVNKFEHIWWDEDAC